MSSLALVRELDELVSGLNDDERAVIARLLAAVAQLSELHAERLEALRRKK